MSEPRLHLLLPGGSRVEVGPEAVVGRARVADVPIADPRVSTVHAEISWREGRFVILARGGRVMVDGTPVREAPLSIGSRITLAPGVVLEVEDVVPGEAPGVAPTAGRGCLVLRHATEGVEVLAGEDPTPRGRVEGLPGQLLLVLLRSGRPMHWSDAATALWPDEGALRAARGPMRTDRWTTIDERRFRNRFDQVLASLRAALEALRPGRWVVLRMGEVSVELSLTDRFEDQRGGG